MPLDADLHGALDAIYRQVEAHTTLVHFLEPRFPLPPMRGWAVSPDFALLMVRELLQRRPSGVFELGTGVSTVLIAYCLERMAMQTRYTAVDHDLKYLERTRDELRAHGLESFVNLVHAPLVEQEFSGERWLWYDANRFGGDEPIDVLIVDGPPASTQSLARYPALPALRSRLAPDSLVLLDDGIREDEKEIMRRWTAEDSRLASEYVPTEKGTVLFRKGQSPGVSSTQTHMV